MKFSKSKLVFFIVFILLILFQFRFGITQENYVGDPWEYSAIGDSIFSSGHFKLSDIDSPIKVWGGGDYRGFVFPILLGMCQYIDHLLGIKCTWWGVSSILYAMLYMVYLRFLEDIGIRNSKNMRVLRDVLPIALTLVFFYGLFIHALTDMLAAFLAVATAELVVIAITTEGRKRFLWYCLSGAVAYLTYNVRTIYLLEFLGLIVAVIHYETIGISRKETSTFSLTKVRNAIVSICAMAFGGYLSAIPQVYLNYTRYNSLSPKVRVQGLFVQQLWWGIGMERYGTYIGNDGVHSVAMRFEDPIGVGIQKAFEDSGYTISLKTYILAFLKYPLDFISVLWKHIWNAMFIIFPETYVEDLSIDRSGYAVLGLVIVILAMFMMADDMRNGVKCLSVSKSLILVALLLPSIAIMFGAMEERYLLVIYLMIYGKISDFGIYSKSKHSVLDYLLKIVLALTIAFTALSIESAVLSGLQGIDGVIPLMINGK